LCPYEWPVTEKGEGEVGGENPLESLDNASIPEAALQVAVRTVAGILNNPTY
jgi:hypothetical protein